MFMPRSLAAIGIREERGWKGHRRVWFRPLLLLAVNQTMVVLSTVVSWINCSEGTVMTQSIGATLRQARELRELSAVEAARAAEISAAYLSRLENNAVKKPSPHVLHQLSEALGLPYVELMRLSGYPVPLDRPAASPEALGTALFANLTEDEREELIEYLAWYRTRRRAKGAGWRRR